MPPRTVLLDTSFVLALENREAATTRGRSNSIANWRPKERSSCCTGESSWKSATAMNPLVDAKGAELLDRFVNEEGFQIAPLSPVTTDLAIALFRSRSDKEWG